MGWVVYEETQGKLIKYHKKMGFSQDEHFDSFYHGGRYALSLVNKALKAAKSGLEIRETDLGEGSGFVLVQADDTEESFAQRVFK